MNNVIETRNLTKRYGTFTAISDIELNIEKGKIYGLIGHNGAGKTTIMKLLAGITLPTEGSISFYGQSNEESLAQKRKKMSFMIETPYMKMEYSGQHNLEIQRLQKGIKDRSRINEVMDIVGLDNVGNKKVKHYSLGMRQRLGLANALLSKPEIMILDEPVNGLDPDGMVEIRNLIMDFNKKSGITIIISSHILTELSQMCSDYIFVKGGRIIKCLNNDQLEQETKKYYSINTDDNNKLVDVIRHSLKTDRFTVCDNGEVRLFNYMDDPKFVAKAIISNGLIPVKFNVENSNLEDFYMKMMED